MILPRLRGPLRISDDEIAEKIGAGELKFHGTRDRYRDFFAAASAWPSRRQRATSMAWSQICNDMIHRVCNLIQEFSAFANCPIPGVPRATVFQS